MNRTSTDSTTRLAAALASHQRAKSERKPEDNPFYNHTLSDMLKAGIRKSSEHYPAVNMTMRSLAGTELENARRKSMAEGKTDTSLKRKAAARARAARKAAFDEIIASPKQPDPERLSDAWQVVGHMFPVITKIADSKRGWAARYLGDVTDDVAGMVLENMALMLAKSDKDLDLLEQAARQIGDRTLRTGLVPGDQLTEDERKERRAIAKSRKWLMQVVNNRVMDTLIDTYFRSHNLKWDNIDRIASVMASINGPGDDPMMSTFHADRSPAMLGTRFQSPGENDSTVIVTAISAGITERGLDSLVELLLANVRTDGSFPWSEMAEQVFACADDGGWRWDAVCQATTGRNRDGKTWTVKRARKARGDAARAYVRMQFDWLPSTILEVIGALVPRRVAYNATAHRALVASDFEMHYLDPSDGVRQPLQPILRFASSQQAAEALIAELSALVTGEDVVKSIVNA